MKKKEKKEKKSKMRGQFLRRKSTLTRQKNGERVRSNVEINQPMITNRRAAYTFPRITDI